MEDDPVLLNLVEKTKGVSCGVGLGIVGAGLEELICAWGDRIALALTNNQSTNDYGIPYYVAMATGATIGYCLPKKTTATAKYLARQTLKCIRYITPIAVRGAGKAYTQSKVKIQSRLADIRERKKLEAALGPATSIKEDLKGTLATTQSAPHTTPHNISQAPTTEDKSRDII